MKKDSVMVDENGKSMVALDVYSKCIKYYIQKVMTLFTDRTGSKRFPINGSFIQIPYYIRYVFTINCLFLTMY